MLLKQSTARNVMVLMVDSSDSKTGKTGLTLTITASKDGGAFASITPTVTERGSGWYSLALTTTHTDTLGDLALHITSTGADATDRTWQVVVKLPGEDVQVSSITSAAIANLIGQDITALTESGFAKVSIYSAIAKLLLKNSTTDVAGNLVVYRSDGTTEHFRQALTTDSAADPITDVAKAS